MSEKFYALGFEQDASDGAIIRLQEAATPLRFILAALGELGDDAREAEKNQGARLKLYELTEVDTVLLSDDEYI